jgi:hypothetical protein
MTHNDILQVEWRSGTGTVGFVAYETPTPANPRLWCAACGPLEMDTVNPPTEDDDALRIANYGCKLSWQEAQAFFPDLDIRDYKYYTN